MKETIGTGCGFFLLLVLIAGLSIGGIGLAWGFQWITAPFRGALDARETIQANGDFRIEAYTTFFNQCSSIQALEEDEDAQVNGLTTATTENDIRIYQANIAALEGARDGSIRRYNADAQKDWTIAQFKSRKLPFTLSAAHYLTLNPETRQWAKGTKTLCATG